MKDSRQSRFLGLGTFERAHRSDPPVRVAGDLLDGHVRDVRDEGDQTRRDFVPVSGYSKRSNFISDDSAPSVAFTQFLGFFPVVAVVPRLSTFLDCLVDVTEAEYEKRDHVLRFTVEDMDHRFTDVINTIHQHVQLGLQEREARRKPTSP